MEDTCKVSLSGNTSVLFPLDLSPVHDALSLRATPHIKIGFNCNHGERGDWWTGVLGS